MLAEDDVVEDAAWTENVADWMWLGSHILDIYDLGSHVARSTASNK